ncbi:hypothetical protein ACFW04_013768 [Cataglyphis niger]
MIRAFSLDYKHLICLGVATEFRQFLLYTGPVVLKIVISHDRYINFLSVHIAIFILCNLNYKKYTDYGRSLIQYFVKTFIILYSKDQVSYNVHNLLHICDDVEIFRTLDQFSAFERSLQQIIRCKYEIDNSIPLDKNKLHYLLILKKQHNMGSITSFLAQYKEIIFFLI